MQLGAGGNAPLLLHRNNRLARSFPSCVGLFVGQGNKQVITEG